MSLEEVYFDNSATTKIFPQVLQEMARVLTEEYGNPSALHRRGSNAERILNSSRQTLAEFLGVKEREIVFTSGGTEANNLAILGLARRYHKRGNHLITSAIEHPSVLGPFRQLAKEGFEVTCLQPDSRGVISAKTLAKALRPETILVSIMHVNNEVGSIQPLTELSNVIKAKNPQIIFHVDGVQSFARLPLIPMEQGIDALSISAHKFHGPKGTGALYLREGLLPEPLLWGGGQERGLRSGTENVTAIAGMALAAKLCRQARKETMDRLQSYKKTLFQALQAVHPWIILNGPSLEEGAPHILNISFPGLKGEIILHALEEHKIYVSTGSACQAREKAQSHVLKALGLDEKNREGALRLSFSYFNTEEEMDFAAAKIIEVITELQKFV
jgi:cysteine desulfurase